MAFFLQFCCTDETNRPLLDETKRLIFSDSNTLCLTPNTSDQRADN